MLMPFVIDSGTKIWYQVTGLKHGQPLILSGGFGLLENQYDFVRELLGRHFQLVDWNYRGAGQSDRAWLGGVYHLDTWVNDLEKILSHLGVQKAIFWGTSTGSLLTIRYATRYPSRVRAVITYPMFKVDPGFKNAFESFTRIGETFGYDALASLTSWIGVAAENLFRPKWAEIAKWESEMFRKNFSIESLGAIMAIVSANDLSGDLDKLKAPTMLLLGESGNLGYATVGNRELTDEFMRRVPHAVLKVIPLSGGTYCMVEAPEVTAAAVIEFVATLPR
jgi:pimeloyl-ACP methyl ester carboxylesterase